MKGYNIILEGPDGAGKTTLYDLIIKEKLCLAGTHTGPPKGKREFKKQSKKDIKFLNKTSYWIFDRFLLGECVYAPLVRGYYPKYMRRYEKKIEDHNVLVVLVADYQTLLKRFDGEFLTKSQLKDCLSMYVEEFKRCNYPKKMIINTAQYSPREIVKEIDKFITLNQKVKYLGVDDD